MVIGGFTRKDVEEKNLNNFGQYTLTEEQIDRLLVIQEEYRKNRGLTNSQQQASGLLPSHLWHRPNTCPGCGRCNHCGRGGYPSGYDIYYGTPTGNFGLYRNPNERGGTT